ncbi:MAG: hypothetical protein SCARUB_02790 [Candidatus Scalindua rubra]|uniref:Uncharacterized protein n=1 Tax=Candidatus Scalindua rubra TaxID=1872076 RepID=A0A1E3X8X3_9BACT|nr:MAG: hypothetical protein SCARUB_02790 [Candidatus Scalindua rubra]
MKQEAEKREPMPSVLKHVREQNPTFSKDEAIKEALAMEDRYNESNKERDAKRNAEFQKQWERALTRESYNTMFEYMDGLGE